MWPGCILETYFGPFRPPGRYKKTRKNSYTPRTQRPHSSRCWSCRNPAAPTRRPAPIKALMTTPTLGEACAVLVKPGEAALTKEGMPAPAPAPAAQVVQRGPLPRVYRPSFLHWSVRWSRRGGTPTATNLRVVEYTRLRRPDGGVVGNRGAAAGLGKGL